MDMGIVTPGCWKYEEIPKDLLELVEDVLLNRRAGRHRAADQVRRFRQQKGKVEVVADECAKGPLRNPDPRPRQGHLDFIDQDTEERVKYREAAAGDEGPLMPA